MNKIVIGVLLVLLSTSAMSGELEIIAEAYLSSFKEKDLEGTAEMLHCPKSYSKQELEKDHQFLTKSLSIFVEEFGVLKNYKVSHNNLYVTAMIACGTTKYWEENKPTTLLVYETKHENNSDGYIVFHFSEINGQLVLAFANHGVPMLGEQSTSKIKQVINRISK